jgi:dinuclear metal center YbgI/SA1388 family protein
MATVNDIHAVIKAFAPLETKLDFDNVGFLVGFKDQVVTRVLVALDVTDDVIAEAIETGCELIVSHHPLFFSLKTVTDEDSIGRKITTMLRDGISALCNHTNLDAAAGGVNDALAEAAGLHDVQLLHGAGHDFTGRPYALSRYG